MTNAHSLRMPCVRHTQYWAVLPTIGIGFVGCSGSPDDHVFTLYRTSPSTQGDSLRLHVATFDSADGERYNNGNCEVARGLFQGQPGVTVRYWCEKGRFRK